MHIVKVFIARNTTVAAHTCLPQNSMQHTGSGLASASEERLAGTQSETRHDVPDLAGHVRRILATPVDDSRVRKTLGLLGSKWTEGKARSAVELHKFDRLVLQHGLEQDQLRHYKRIIDCYTRLEEVGSAVQNATL